MAENNKQGKSLSGAAKTISIAGGTGIFLTALLKAYPTAFSKDVMSAITYSIPAISAVVAEILRWLGAIGGELESSVRLYRAERSILKSLKSEHISDSAKDKLRKRLEQIALMKADPTISITLPEVS